MNPRSVRAYEALPDEIANFEKGSAYQFIVGVDERVDDKWPRDDSFALFRADLVPLTRYYTALGRFTDAEAASLLNQLYSTDKEAWYMAFVILDQTAKAIKDDES